MKAAVWGRRVAGGAGAVLVLALVWANWAYGRPPPGMAERLRYTTARLNLSRIGTALLLYAERHGGGREFPPSLDALFEHGLLDDRAVLRCPSLAGSEEPHLVYLPGLALDAPSPVFTGQELVLLYERGLPERYEGDSFAAALRSDLELFNSFGRELAPVASAQAAALHAVQQADPATLTRLLSGTDALARRLAAWRLSRDTRETPPALLAALEVASAAPDRELALYAGLALAGRGQARGAIAALDGLGTRLERVDGRGFWQVGGPRRRLLLEQLARLAPAAVAVFPYDPATDQLAALRRWRSLLED